MALTLKKVFLKAGENLEQGDLIAIKSKGKIQTATKVVIDSSKQIPVEKLEEKNLDKILEAVKTVLNKDYCSKRGIKWIQNGFRLIMYQGKRANMYGVIEARENKPHFIRIYNSALLRELKKQDETKEIFKDVL